MKKWLTPVVMIIAVLVIGFYVITAYMARRVNNQVLQAFKTVNNSIDTSNTKLSRANEKAMLYTQLAATVTPEEAIKLTLLENKTAAYSKYLDSLKQVFRTGMTSEENITFSKDFFVKDGNGNRLFWKMHDLQSVFATVAASDSMRQQLKDMGVQIVNGETVTDSDAFTNAYFATTPAIAVLTLLSSFQNNSTNSELAILKDYSNLVQLRKTK